MYLKKVLVLLLVSLTSNLSYAQKENKFFRNDYHYLEATESFYKINSLPRTWDEAKKACALEGAILWFPDNQKEADTVISYWNSTQPTWWSIYVGLSDLLVKGRFDTIEGKRVEDVYHYWSIGEPDNYLGIEGCVILNANGKIINFPCDKKNPFICKKSLHSLEWNQLCNMPDLGYNYNARNGHCYKLHSNPLNWTDAYNACSSEQAYLAVINDWLEVDDLVKLAENSPKDWVAGSYLRGLYHVGFHNRYNDGWSTVKGAAINETIPWWGSQPTTETHDQCGSMFYTGRLSQINCGSRCFFICEHEVDLSIPEQDIVQ